MPFAGILGRLSEEQVLGQCYTSRSIQARNLFSESNLHKVKSN